VQKRTAVSHQLTSIFPSTTVAALSSFWTGAAPAQHGMMGLNIFFPQMAAAGR
jgi:predicted AlkP superfamily pyrophosphatase or phosphodiesterase